MLKFLSVFFVGVLVVQLSQTAHAQSSHSAFYSVKQTLGDGSGGRVWKQWRQPIPNKPVQTVRIRLRKKTGGDDAFVNLRYGDGGTFENGKQVFLRDNQSKTVSWNVGGVSPNGQELVLNAYKGEVYVDNVNVYFTGHTLKEEKPRRPKPRPRPDYQNPSGSRGDNDFRDQYYDDAERPRRERDDDDDDDDERREERYDENRNDDRRALRNCRRIRRTIRRPEIEIYESRPTGGLFSGKYKIRGEIYGACIEEAGYYESGELKEKIDIALSDRYNRARFKFRVRTGRRGQIRVFTFDGRREVIDIDALILRDRQGQQGQGQIPIPLPF